MRARGGEADFEHVMAAAPGMENGAAAALAMGVDEVGDRRVEAGLPQRLDNEIALPGAIVLGVSSAARRSRRKRRNAGRSARCARALGCVDAQQMPPVGMARHGLDLDGFAGQRAGHVDRLGAAVGDAVAAMAEPVDHQPLNHARPR